MWVSSDVPGKIGVTLSDDHESDGRPERAAFFVSQIYWDTSALNEPSRAASHSVSEPISATFSTNSSRRCGQVVICKALAWFCNKPGADFHLSISGG